MEITFDSFQVRQALPPVVWEVMSPHYIAGMYEALLRFDKAAVCKVGKPCKTEEGDVICIPKNHICRGGDKGSDAPERRAFFALGGVPLEKSAVKPEPKKGNALVKSIVGIGATAAIGTLGLAAIGAAANAGRKSPPKDANNRTSGKTLPTKPTEPSGNTPTPSPTPPQPDPIPVVPPIVPTSPAVTVNQEMSSPILTPEQQHTKASLFKAYLAKGGYGPDIKISADKWFGAKGKPDQQPDLEKMKAAHDAQERLVAVYSGDRGMVKLKDLQEQLGLKRGDMQAILNEGTLSDPDIKFEPFIGRGAAAANFRYAGKPVAFVQFNKPVPWSDEYNPKQITPPDINTPAPPPPEGTPPPPPEGTPPPLEGTKGTAVPKPTKASAAANKKTAKSSSETPPVKPPTITVENPAPTNIAAIDPTTVKSFKRPQLQETAQAIANQIKGSELKIKQEHGLNPNDAKDMQIVGSEPGNEMERDVSDYQRLLNANQLVSDRLKQPRVLEAQYNAEEFKAKQHAKTVQTIKNKQEEGWEEKSQAADRNRYNAEIKLKSIAAQRIQVANELGDPFPDKLNAVAKAVVVEPVAQPIAPAPEPKPKSSRRKKAEAAAIAAVTSTPVVEPPSPVGGIVKISPPAVEPPKELPKRRRKAAQKPLVPIEELPELQSNTPPEPQEASTDTPRRQRAKREIIERFSTPTGSGVSVNPQLTVQTPIEKQKGTIRLMQGRIKNYNDEAIALNGRVEEINGHYDRIIERNRDASVNIGGSGESLLTEDLEARRNAELKPINEAIASTQSKIATGKRKVQVQKAFLKQMENRQRIADTTFGIDKAQTQGATEAATPVTAEIDARQQKLREFTGKLSDAVATRAEAMKTLDDIGDIEYQHRVAKNILNAQKARQKHLQDEVSKRSKVLKTYDEALKRGNQSGEEFADTTKKRFATNNEIEDISRDLQSLNETISGSQKYFDGIAAQVKARTAEKAKATKALRESEYNIEQIYKPIRDRELQHEREIANLRSAAVEGEGEGAAIEASQKSPMPKTRAARNRAVAEYRAKHPGTKLSDLQILDALFRKDSRYEDSFDRVLDSISGKTRRASKIHKVMREFKHGKLHVGKSNKFVKSRKQAIAIAINMGNKAAKSPVRKKK